LLTFMFASESQLQPDTWGKETYIYNYYHW